MHTSSTSEIVVTPEIERRYPKLSVAAATPAADTSPYAAQIQAWTSYTRYLAAFAGLLPVVDSIVDRLVQDKNVQADILAALQATYKAAQGVDNEFLAGIKSMEAGTPPQYNFDPVPIPNWPDPNGNTTGFFDEVWNMVKPVLEQVMTKVASASPIAAAVAGLINSGDAVAAILDKTFHL